MIEAYRIGVNLVANTSGVTGPIGRLIESFERLLKIQKQVQANLNNLASGTHGAVVQADLLATAWERVARAAASVHAPAAPPGGTAGGAGTGYAGGGEDSTARRLAGPRRLPPLLLYDGGGGGGAPPGGTALMLPGAAGGGGPIPLSLHPPRGKFPAHDAAMAGVAAGAVGYGAGAFLDEVFSAGFDAATVLAQMKAQRFTPDQIAQSRAMARGLVGRVPGFSFAQGLDLILQTSSFTGNVPEALSLAPSLAFDAQVLRQFGKGDAIAQVEAAAKAGELTGLTGADGQINMPKFTDFVNRLTATVVSGGGTLDIKKYLTGIRQFGAGADAADVDFLTAVLPAYMKIMGEAKSGTALSSFEQSMLGPKPRTTNKKIWAEQERLGLRGASGELSEADRELLTTDPGAYILTRILPALHRNGYSTPAQIRAELPKFLPRQTIERLVAAGIFDEAVILKEAARNRAQIAAGQAPLAELLRQSPQNQVAAFRASLNLLMVTLAEPSMGSATKALGDITAAVNAVAGAIEAHPGTARALIDLAAGVATLGAVASVALLSVAPLLALRKVMGWGVAAAGDAAVGAAAGGGAMALARRLGPRIWLPALGAYAVNEADSGDKIGNWVDRNVPGAGAIDDWVYRHTGGVVGKPSGWTSGAPNQPMPVIVVNPADIGRGAADYMTRQLNRPGNGTTGYDPRATPLYPGATPIGP